MEYTIRKVDTPEDLQEIESLFEDYFMSLPTTTIFGMKKTDNPPRSLKTLGPTDFVLKASDSSGNIIGFATNKARDPNPGSVTRVTNASPERKQFEDFLEFAFVNAEVEKLPRGSLELQNIYVYKDLGRLGIGKRLAEESVRLAREAGFKAMWAYCVSEFSASLLKGLGWQEHFRLAYKDYPSLSGKDVKFIQNPPHNHQYLYVLSL